MEPKTNSKGKNLLKKTMLINFNSLKIKFRLKNEAKISTWIQEVLLKEKKSSNEINYIFCNDDSLLNLNRKYLNHNTLTDILTFEVSPTLPFKQKSRGKTSGREKNQILFADIFISIPRVKENAKTFNFSFEDELSRVMVHGILHLCGYGDKNTGEKKTMRKMENFYLAVLKKAS